MTKIRVIFSNPYATNCSSGEQSPEKIVSKNSKSPYKFVYRKKGTRKWTSEFRDSITRKRYYLGSFETAEAAHQAYCTKKQELEEKPAVKKKPLEEKPAVKKKPLEEKAVHSDCSLDEYSEPGYKIRTRKRAETIQRPVREIRNKVSACCETDHESEKTPGKIGAIRKTRYRRGIQEKEAYGKEKQECKFSRSISSEMASLIMDEDCYLLGEFSGIDDLTICEGDE